MIVNGRMDKTMSVRRDFKLIFNQRYVSRFLQHAVPGVSSELRLSKSSADDYYTVCVIGHQLFFAF